MFENKKFDLRISEELLNQCKASTDNLSLFIREAIRDKLESGLLIDPSLSLVEIRCRTPYTYFAELIKVIDGDTLNLNIDLGFFIKAETKVRLIGIDTKPIDTEEGKKAYEFVQNELTDSNLLIEVHKKEKYGRYLVYVYYHKEKSEFEDIIRHGKLLNEELITRGLANKYID